MELVLVPIVGLAIVGLVLWFIGLENRNERHTIFIVLVMVIVVEATLAGHASNVPVGLLRPAVAGQDFRPPDAVILSALFARLVTTRGDNRVPLQTLWWYAFFGWYLAGVVFGLANGFQPQDVLFQGKALMYLFGAMTIASGADLERVARSIPKFSYVLAAITVNALIFESIGFAISFSTPLQRFHSLGRLSNDSITLLTAVGAMTLLIEATQKHRRVGVGIAGLILLLSPIAGQQRASFLAMSALLVGLAIAAFGTTWRRRTHVTGTGLTLLGSLLVALVFVGFIATSSTSIVTGRFEEAFAGEAESRSASARVTLIDQAVDRIRERPVTGWGVGVKVERKAVQSKEAVEAAAHNIIMDVTMRTGIFGMLLLTAAVASTTRLGLRRWREERSDQVAAVAFGAVLIMYAVLTKGLVEPALEKFRLSSALGICLGLVVAHAFAGDVSDPDEGDENVDQFEPKSSRYLASANG